MAVPWRTAAPCRPRPPRPTRRRYSNRNRHREADGCGPWRSRSVRNGSGSPALPAKGGGCGTHAPARCYRPSSTRTDRRLLHHRCGSTVLADNPALVDQRRAPREWAPMTRAARRCEGVPRARLAIGERRSRREFVLSGCWRAEAALPQSCQQRIFDGVADPKQTRGRVSACRIFSQCRPRARCSASGMHRDHNERRAWNRPVGGA